MRWWGRWNGQAGLFVPLDDRLEPVGDRARPIPQRAGGELVGGAGGHGLVAVA